MRSGVSSIMKQGTEHLSGLQEAVLRNLAACKELSDVTRTSFGPNGMNKMVINHIDKLFVTSDCATMLREMEVQHPAAKMLLMAATMQEYEIGDGSNLVVTFAGELLSKAEDLVRMGLHPSEIVAGYNKAALKALELLEGLTALKLEHKDMFDKEQITKGCYSAIASKQYGVESFLAPLVAEACLTVMPANPYNFLVDNVRVVKILGSSLQNSEVVKGMVIAHDTIGTLKEAKEAKIAVFTGSLAPPETETKGTVLLSSADDLLNFSASEETEMEKTIKAIADMGVKVVVTGGSVEDMAAHFLEKYGMMTVKVTSKFDLRRLCKAIKAQPAVNLGPIDTEMLGYASLVYVREVGARKITVFSQDRIDDTSVATVLLRASTDSLLNDVERAVDDGVNVVRMMGRDARFVAGAGATEIELARLLRQHAAKTPGLEQYAINSFAEALEIVPRTLGENSGQNANELLSQLYAAHEKGQTFHGVDVEEHGLKDVKEAGVFDLLVTKAQALKLAVDAATTVLRVDQIISAKPAGGPKMPKGQGHWDDQE